MNIFKAVGFRTGSFLWSAGSKLTHALMGAGILKPAELKSFVISVGNLQAGGSGKTPLVSLIAHEALSKGKTVCILTRGYGGALEKKGGVIAAGSSSVDAAQFGDEVALLQRLLPQAWIAVGAVRTKSYEKAVRELNGLSESPQQKSQTLLDDQLEVGTLEKQFDIVILDDGFQHWKIKKDREVLAVTSRTPSQILFRDFLSAAHRADLLVWTKGSSIPQAIEKSKKPWTKVRYSLSITQEALQHSYWLVSGIGDARFFLESAQQAGLKVKRELRFEDHRNYTAKFVESLCSEAEKAGCKIALTGKDWMKWKTSAEASLAVKNILVLEPDIVFEQGREIWEKVLWS